MNFIGLLRTLEQITRPPRRGAESEDGEPVGETLCPTDGGRCECDRTSQGCIAYHTTETKLADLKADRGTGAINDGEPQQVTLSGREYERYLDGALNEPDDDETPNPTETWEPELNSSERVAVRQLIEERFPTYFAGAAASLADERFIQPSAGVSSFGSSSAREDKQQDEVIGLASVKSPADPHKTSPAAVPSSGQPAGTERLSDAVTAALLGADSPFNKSHGPSCRILAPHYITPTGMDHQCYCARPQGHPLDDFGHRPHICPCGQLWADLHTKSSASNHTGTGAEPAPSPTVVQSAPPPTVDGEGPSACEHSPAPAEGRPPHPVPREQRQGTYCEDYETDGCSVDVCPDGCYHALKDAALPDDAAAEWIGEAVPVISGVLARHIPVNTSKHTPSVFCNSITGQYCHEYADWQAWREHIAPILANALAPKPK